MTLNTSEPSDVRLVSELASYIREDRVAINSFLATDAFDVTELDVPAGTTSLFAGVELSVSNLEVIIIAGSGISTIANIYGGNAGQIKIFVFQDGFIDITDSITKANGTFYLNQEHRS